MSSLPTLGLSKADTTKSGGAELYYEVVWAVDPCLQKMLCLPSPWPEATLPAGLPEAESEARLSVTNGERRWWRARSQHSPKSTLWQGSCLPLPRDALLSTALGNHVAPACLGDKDSPWRLVSLFLLLCCAAQCPNPSQWARRTFLRAGRWKRSWLFLPWQCAGACSLQELGQRSIDPKYRELWVLPDFLYNFGKTPWHLHFSSLFCLLHNPQVYNCLC